MRIRVIAVGKQMPAWVDAAFETYQKRVSGQFQLMLHEVQAVKRTKNSDLERVAREEGQRILAAIPEGYCMIALERIGKSVDSQQLAGALAKYQGDGENLAIVIGGAEGLDPSCLEKAREVWSLSALTMAHPVVRVVLAEQLYRACTILQNHPYHR
ncbi:MAG: 23S rRNA (pseudouridine(1915)-N(3))-methyltransferase RlmH [Gammaproteobacteria bacterium]|nr:23S rRNA (pseudouridine(1915)-N(3))-methyltransferase RlmH [Gammaproteobacteria bacterium]